MSNLTKIFLLGTAALSISACSSNSSSSGSTGGTGTTQLTMSTLTAGYSLNTTAHKGLEFYTLTNGAAVNAGALPTGSLATSPTATLVTTATGYTLTLPDGKAVTYNTQAGVTDITRGTVIERAGTQYDALVTGGTTNQDVELTLTSNVNSTLTYSTYGLWSEADAAGNPLNIGVFATGVPTTSAQMPTTGTATYTGNISGAALTPTTVALVSSGTVSLNANFASNTITGSVTNIATVGVNNGPAGIMNSLNLTGGTISGTSFTGTAAAAAAVGTTTINITGATGTFGGNFYGPNAAEAAGSISVTGGGSTVFASFGAHK